jgi:phosphate transport system permease protein
LSAITTPEVAPASGPPPASGPQNARARLNSVDKRANRALKGLAFAGGAIVFLAMFFIAYEVITGASMAIGKFGIGFIGSTEWNPVENEFGAWPFIYGTLVTSFFSLILATILGVSIGLFLSLMAPRPIATVVGPLVEMLAAIPSVVLGLIGIYLIAPFVSNDVESPLHAVLGFIPVFGTPQPVGNSLFTASLVLTIMVVPIIAALSRDLFLTVPQELRDGAEALGATRWEMIRGVVLPTTRSGVIAACVLGFGRAIGEAIAVSQVVGDQPLNPVNWFMGGDTLASRVALQWEGSVSALHTSALFYLALILFVFGLIVNLMARQISHGGLRLSLGSVFALGPQN